MPSSAAQKSRYEYQVRLGLMLIVFVLLFLNFSSNYIIYRAHGAQKEAAIDQMRQAALTISRVVQETFPAGPSEQRLEPIRREFSLREVKVLPSRPSGLSDQSREDWYRRLTQSLKARSPRKLAQELAGTPVGGLARGDGAAYYFIYPVPRGGGHTSVVLVADFPHLAYLDDSRDYVLHLLIGALLALAAVYVVLSRLIFQPFRRLRRQVAESGRPVEISGDETEAIVAEYERTIEELRSKEAELIEAHELMRNRADSLERFNQYLIESGRAGTITLDRKGRVVSVNEAARVLLQLPDGAYEGASLNTVLGGADRLREDIEAAITSREARDYLEYEGLFEDRPDVVLSASVACIRDQQQSALGYLVILNDLTELTRLRRELESRNRLVALGEMAGGLAHQLRNSLGAIGGYATLLKKQLKSAELPEERAEVLSSEAKQAEELIKRFLDFARPLRFAPEPVSLRSVVDDAIAQAQAAGNSDCEIQISCDGDLTVEADSVLLKQVIGNLIDNAVRSCEGRPTRRVQVAVRDKSDQAVIEVADTGCGISPNDLDRIFTPFYSSSPGGTGLGLSLARKIVDLHSGSLTVRSQLDQGTTFRISLPLEHSTAPTLENSAAPA